MSELKYISDYLVVPYVRQVGFAVRKPWKAGLRRLMDYLLIYVQEGQFCVNVDGQEYQVEEKGFCLIPPNSVLTMEGKTETITPFAHLDFFYNPLRDHSFPTKPGQTDLTDFQHLIQPRLNEMANIHVPIIITPSQPVIFRDTLLKLIELWESHGRYYELHTQHLATTLFMDLLDVYQSETTHRSDSMQMLNWVTSYINFNLSLPLSLSDMATRAMLSPSRFRTVFRQHFGISPHQYLLRSRVQYAEQLLKNQSMTMDEIALNCGFANVHHFSREFKKKTGASPGAFRKTISW